MKILFKTIVTSQRHREQGTFEDSDFGSIRLIELDPSEKELIVSFDEYKDKKEYIKVGNYVYSKMGGNPYLCGMSREDEDFWIAKQGKFSSNLAIRLMLTLRPKLENRFSGVDSVRYVLIGRTLYSRYCKIEDLNITVCGNMLFAHWISINIEAHGGKENIKLSKENFIKTVKEQKARWNDGNPNATSIDGHKHSCFSVPTNVKWGNI